MTPYYDHAGITIYHGDCHDVVPGLAFAGLVLADPPYGIAYRGGGGGNLIHSKRHRKSERVRGDNIPFNPAEWLTFEHVAMFGAQHFYNRLPSGGTFHVWDKRGPYREVHTADFDTVWINRKETGRILRCVWRGICRETEHLDRIVHPTQKPLVVVRWVRDLFEPMPILDPYMGSGTTLLAAKELGRRAIGVELEERYCEIAAKRLAQETLSFVPAVDGTWDPGKCDHPEWNDGMPESERETCANCNAPGTP